MHINQPKPGRPMTREEIERRRKRLVTLVPKILDALETYTNEAEKLKNQIERLPPDEKKVAPPPSLSVKKPRTADPFALVGWALAIGWALAFFLRGR